MAVAALAAFEVRWLTFDATSPMRDAAEGTLYVTRPSHQKVRTRKVAARLATDSRAKWDCPCGACRAFTTAHPWDLDTAREWSARTGASTVTADDLRPGGALYRALPLLSEPQGGALRKAVTEARVGHNHWAIEQLLRTLRRTKSTHDRLDTAVRRLISEYADDTSLASYADAAWQSCAIVSRQPPFDIDA